MKWWFYILIIPWLFIMVFGVLAFHDFGFDALLITSNGVQYWIDVAINGVILLYPLLLFPFAKKRKDNTKS